MQHGHWQCWSAYAHLCRPQRLPAALLVLQRARRGAQRARLAAAVAALAPSSRGACAAGCALLRSRLCLPRSLLRGRLPLRLFLPPGLLLCLLTEKKSFGTLLCSLMVAQLAGAHSKADRRYMTRHLRPGALRIRPLLLRSFPRRRLGCRLLGSRLRGHLQHAAMELC